MSDEKQVVVAAAYAWWRSHRPDAWDEPQHLACADVNCRDNAERNLARAVAAAIAASQETIKESLNVAASQKSGEAL